MTSSIAIQQHNADDRSFFGHTLDHLGLTVRQVHDAGPLGPHLLVRIEHDIRSVLGCGGIDDEVGMTAGAVLFNESDRILGHVQFS